MLALDTIATPTTGAVAHGRQPASGSDPSLRAVQRLTRAANATLLCLDRRDGAVSVLAGAEAGATLTAGPEIHAAIESAAAIMYGAAQPLWIVSPDGGATMLIKLTERGTTTLLLALELPDATAVTRARVAKLAPDLVTLLGAGLDLETRNAVLAQQNAAAMAALDHDEVGVIAVRADHSIVFANAAAAAMLAGQAGLQVRRGVLRAAHHRDTAAFQSALDAVAEPPRAARAEGRHAFVMLLTSEGRKHPVIAAVAPLSKAARAATEHEAVAIVHLLAADTGAASAIEVLCRLHGLSRVETRLVRHLCDGNTVNEAAAEMRIKVETARAYLKQVFAKTRTHRQADLALLISRYARAIQGPFDFQPA